ncbi:hypothetical protein [Pantoea allii]|nr:hypothetical protein [Pantoea allii]MDJ0039052.1 hypothetical protein [Pantoea allii]
MLPGPIPMGLYPGGFGQVGGAKGITVVTLLNAMQCNVKRDQPVAAG